MADLTEQKIQKILDLSESNNRILRSIKRSLFWGRVIHTLYWIIIIGASIGAFYFLKPYLSQVEDLYSGLKSGTSSVQDAGGASFGEFLKNLGR